MARNKAIFPGNILLEFSIFLIRTELNLAWQIEFVHFLIIQSSNAERSSPN